MSKGKYAAKAANRAAATDNEVIVELRRKLAEAQKERDSLQAELDATLRRMDGEVNRRVDVGTVQERLRMQQTLDAAQEEVRERLDAASEELVEFVRNWTEVLEEQYGADSEFLPRSAFRTLDDTSGPSFLRLLDMLGVQKAGQTMDRAFRLEEHGRGGFGTPQRTLRRRSPKSVSQDLKLSAAVDAVKSGRPDLVDPSIPMELVSKAIALEKRTRKTASGE